MRGLTIRDLRFEKDRGEERREYHDEKVAEHERLKPIERERVSANGTQQIEAHHAYIAKTREEIQGLMDQLENFEPVRELRNLDPEQSDDPYAWALKP
jgi:hypothetical protein